MRNIIKNIIIILLSITTLAMGIWIVNIYYHQPKAVVVWRDCVPDSESAINIARVVCKAYYGEDFRSDDFYCFNGDTEWQIILKYYDIQEYPFMCDDGGITINKKNGTIGRVWISEKNIDDFRKYQELKKENGDEK